MVNSESNARNLDKENTKINTSQIIGTNNNPKRIKFSTIPSIITICFGFIFLILGMLSSNEVFGGILSSPFLITGTVLFIKSKSEKLRRTTFYMVASIIIGGIGVLLLALGISVHEAFAHGGFLLFYVAVAFVFAAIVVIFTSGEILKGFGIVKLLLLITVAFSFGRFAANILQKKRYQNAPHITVQNRLTQLGTELTKYAQEHKGYLPKSEQWCDLLMKQNKKVTKETFQHPQIKNSSIAFNKNLDGLRLLDIPNDVVLLFEAEGGWNLTGGQELIKKENTSRVIVYILLANKEIKTFWTEYEGIRVGGKKVVPVRWKP